MIRLVRSDVGERVANLASAAGSMQATRDVLADALGQLDRADLIAQLDERVAKINRLQAEGYAPLMRFGR